MEDLTTIYKSEYNDVTYLDGDSDYVVFAFSERREPAPAAMTGLSFFRKRKIRAIIFRSLKNSWWIDSDFNTALKSAETFNLNFSPSKIIGYGFSMGSFGVFSSYKKMHYDRIVVAGPVLNIDPEFDNRWSSDYRHLITSQSDLDHHSSDYKCPIVAFFDPSCPDAKQIAKIQNLPQESSCMIFVDHAGHMVPGYLQQSGVLSELIEASFSGEINKSEAENLIWRKRKLNITYLLQLSDKCRKNPRRQSLIMNRAAKIGSSNHTVIFRIAATQSQNKNYTESLDIISDLLVEKPNFRLNEEMAKFACTFVESGGKLSDISPFMEEYKSDKPRPRSSQLWFSRYLRLTKQYDEAFKSHVSYMKKDAFSAQAHHERGLIFEELGLRSLAIEQYTLALEVVPGFTRSKIRLDALLSLVCV